MLCNPAAGNMCGVGLCGDGSGCGGSCTKGGEGGCGGAFAVIRDRGCCANCRFEGTSAITMCLGGGGGGGSGFTEGGEGGCGGAFAATL